MREQQAHQALSTTVSKKQSAEGLREANDFESENPLSRPDEKMGWPLRRWFRLFWVIICSLTLLALPLIIWDFFRKGMPIKYQAWFIGGIFCLISIPISIYEVAMHIEYYTRPRLQRHVIRILWMVPIYAVDAWFALRFRSAREYLDPVRECYEAYVIWNFFAYLMAYLEDEQGDVELYLARKPPMQHFFPFSYCLAPWTMGHKFLLETKKGVMNYVILRPLTTSIGLFTDIFDKYGQGHIDFTKSYVYLVAVTNFSQLWALYCLAQMYWACHKELAPIRPLSKFVCIKAVVFLTFWQGTVLAVLVSSGLITDQSWSTYDQLGVASGIQDFLVCVEMFIAALAHAYAFPPKDYMGVGQTKGFIYNVKHMFDLRDVVQDLGLVVESHVGVAAGAVTSTTQAVLTAPKKAVKSVGKGLKAAAHLTLSPFSSGDVSKQASGSNWARGPSDDEHEEGNRLEEGQLQPLTEFEVDRRPLLPPPSQAAGSSGGAQSRSANTNVRRPLLSDTPASSSAPDVTTLHQRRPSDPPALSVWMGSESGGRPARMHRSNSRSSIVEELATGTKQPQDRPHSAHAKSSGLGLWWGGSSSTRGNSSERPNSFTRGRAVRDEQQPLLNSHPDSPSATDNPLKHDD